MTSIQQYLAGRAYPGRGLFLGLHADGKRAVIAYFIMGRSVNSRNRLFVAEGDGLRTQAYDPALLSDPSLIIYAPVRVAGSDIIVSNGDQTDSIREALQRGESFHDALRRRCYEPDAPNYTPRISGLLHRGSAGFSYTISILKRDEHGGCLRFFYEYAEPAPGVGHLIHTYRADGDPLPAFAGEPAALSFSGGIDQFSDTLWQALNADNRVALFVRYLDPTGGAESRIINRNGGC